MVSYTIGLEQDGTEVRVVVRRASDGSLVGVPFRSTRPGESERMLTPLRYAFEYGLRAMREQVGKLSDRVTEAASREI